MGVAVGGRGGGPAHETCCPSKNNAMAAIHTKGHRKVPKEPYYTYTRCIVTFYLLE